MRRVAVIGVTGSGKSRLADALSTRLGLPCVELDALYWGANWTPREDFQARVATCVAEEAWVIDGNYSQVRDRVWLRADTIIWLDYPLATILHRLLGRTARRVLNPQPLWAGNRERLSRHLSRDSLFVWAVASFRRYRREYPPELLKVARRGTHIVRFRSPRQTRQWLTDLLVNEPR